MGRNTKYNLPSGEILPPSLSEIEQKYINREIKEERKQWEWVMIVLGVLALLLLTWVYFQVPEVHAQETPRVLKTNKDYCLEWYQGVWQVQGASREQMTNLCKEYKS